MLIKILNSVWRYDMIAAIELVDYTITVIEVHGECRDYEFEDEEDAEAVYAAVHRGLEKGFGSTVDRLT